MVVIQHLLFYHNFCTKKNKGKHFRHFDEKVWRKLQSDKINLHYSLAANFLFGVLLFIPNAIENAAAKAPPKNIEPPTPI